MYNTNIVLQSEVARIKGDHTNSIGPMEDSVISVLHTILKENGIDLYCDNKRLRALLNDLAPRQKREVNLLMQAVDAQIPHTISANPRSVDKLTIQRLIRVMTGQYGTAQEHAQWTVEAWAEVLGKLPTSALRGNGHTSKGPRPPVTPVVSSDTSSSASNRQAAKAHIEAGEELAARKNWQGAVEEYERARHIYPEAGRIYDVEISTAHFEHAQACKGRGRYRQAADSYSVCLELDSQWTEIYSLRGECYLVLGELDEAVTDFGEALKVDRDDVSAYCGRGEARFKKGLRAEAAKDFENALKRDVSNSNALYWQAKLLLDKHPEKAVANLEHVVELNPRHVDALLELASWYRKPNPARAVAYYSQLLDEEATHTTALTERGCLHMQLKRYTAAIDDFNSALRIDPDLTHLYYQRGLAYRYLQKFKEAKADFERALHYHPQDADIYFHLGYLLFKQKNLNDALAYISDAIQYDPKHAEAYVLRGRIRAEKGFSAKALEDYTQAIKLNPDLFDAYFWRASLYEQAGDVDSALADCDIAFQLNSSNSDLLTRQINLYRKKDDAIGVIASMRKLFAIISADEQRKAKAVTYCRNYANQSIEKSELLHAVVLREYVAELVQDAEASHALFEIYLLYADHLRVQGHFVEALGQYEKAQRIQPLSGVSQLLSDTDKANMADAYLLRGNERLSRLELDAAIDDFLNYMERACNPSAEFFGVLAQAYQQRGTMKLEQGDFAAAAEDYNHALTFAPENSTCYYQLGLAYAQSKKLDAAVASFNESIRLNPDHALSYKQRALILYKQKSYDDAILDYEQGVSLDPALSADSEITHLREYCTWKPLLDLFENQTVFQGEVTCVSRHRLIVRFESMSVHVSKSQRLEVSHQEGDLIRLVFTEVNPVSKALFASEWRAIIQDLNIGELREGSITRIEEYGIFVDIGDVVGLVHRSEFSSKRIDPFEKYTIGETVRVKVISTDPISRKVGLSVKQVQNGA